MSNSIMEKLRKQQQAAKAGTATSATKPTSSIKSSLTKSKQSTDGLKGTIDSSNAGQAGGSTDLGNPLSKAKQLLINAQEKVSEREEKGYYKVAQSSLPQELDANTLSTKLANLDMALLAKTPELPTLQLEIMRNLRQYEELTHILSDEQLSIITSGCMELANVSIATGKNGAGKTSTARLDSLTSGLGASDF